VPTTGDATDPDGSHAPATAERAMMATDERDAGRPLMRVLLIRHGRSTWNVERRWQGWADPALSPEGVAQAEAAAAAMEDLAIRVVVCSDLARARSTAEIIAGVVGVGVSVEPALRERDVGLWSGLTSDEVEARWPGQLEAYRTNPGMQFPNGEGAEALLRRAMPALLTIAQQDPHDGVAVVVSHGGLIRCVRLALGATDRAVPGLAGCWLEARGKVLRLVADADPG
jgi:broad specificity phosphatase PhoE